MEVLEQTWGATNLDTAHMAQHTVTTDTWYLPHTRNLYTAIAPIAVR
jgi:hypothetical protein